ncbi:unnamed protein product [Heterotrigona itama]|uniref:Uncharacterized protein n=1 Tax=Heterotrigona itama TaxID=395501 RepID=A0A6V7GTG8_9HYME|nr:unnamed protein product [Heterotrigona itama]
MPSLLQPANHDRDDFVGAYLTEEEISRGSFKHRQITPRGISRLTEWKEVFMRNYMPTRHIHEYSRDVIAGSNVAITARLRDNYSQNRCCSVKLPDHVRDRGPYSPRTHYHLNTIKVYTLVSSNLSINDSYHLTISTIRIYTPSNRVYIGEINIFKRVSKLEDRVVDNDEVKEGKEKGRDSPRIRWSVATQHLAKLFLFSQLASSYVYYESRARSVTCLQSLIKLVD